MSVYKLSNRPKSTPMITDFTSVDFKYDFNFFEEPLIRKGIQTAINNFENRTSCSCLLLSSEEQYLYSNNWEFEKSLIDNVTNCLNRFGKQENILIEQLIYALESDGRNEEIKFHQNYKWGNILLFYSCSKKKACSDSELEKVMEEICNLIDIGTELQNQKYANQKNISDLKLQKSFFENLLNNSPDAIAILDDKDTIIGVNKEFEHLFGYKQSDVKSKNINDLIVPNNCIDDTHAVLQETLNGNLVDVITIRKSKTGKEIHVEILAKPIVLDNQQRVVYVEYRNLTKQIWQQKSQDIVFRISELLNSTMKPAHIIDRISKEVNHVVGEGNLFLDLVSNKGNSFKSYCSESGKFNDLEIRESLSCVIVNEKIQRSFTTENILSEIKANDLSMNEVPKSWIGFPLIGDNEVLGVFGVQSFQNTTNIDSNSLELLELISLQLATGLLKFKKDYELKMLQRSMEQSPASIVITDLEGKIEYVNPKFCEISGYSYDDLIGRNPKILKSGYTPKEVYKDLWQTITAGKEWVGEFLNVKKNKELYWERASFSAIRDEYGSITNFLSVKEDISEHKQFEKQLMEAKNKAEESDRMKSTFLANMSHELRTPLNAVIGFSNLCDADMDKDQILDFVSLINKSGNQLLGIIEDILSFTAIEGEGLELNEEEFLMSYFLEELREKSIEKQALKNKGRLELRFVSDSNYSNVLVKADFAKLSHGILNLINNGLKFTHEGFVEIGYFIRGKQVNIYIEDSGVGIEKEKKDIIFESFRQSDDSITRTFGGTGLGLSITKKIIDKMGGKIEVESEPQKGTRFTVSLDCIISKEENMEIQNSNDNPVILVAEDELSNFRLIDAILKRHNYTVLRAEDGEEAIEMCKKNKSIVLVLMDIRMPGTNGLEATKSIKSQLPNLPVIAQTAYAMDGDKDKALAAGCDDYLSKPIRKDLLLSKLVQYINL